MIFSPPDFMSFFHVTYLGNIDSILKNGIVSRKLANNIQEKGTSPKIENHADDGVINNRNSKNMQRKDLDYSIEDYALLYLNPRNATLFRLQKENQRPVIIEIDKSILENHGIYVTDRNYACRDCLVFKVDVNNFDDTQEKMIDFDRLWSKFWHDDELTKHIMQAELLIPFVVEPRMITKFHINPYEEIDPAKIPIYFLQEKGIDIDVSGKYYFDIR